jgi:hypothetical protein
VFSPNARNRLGKSKNSVRNLGRQICELVGKVCTYLHIQHKRSTCPKFARVLSNLQKLHGPLDAFVFVTCALHIYL